MKKRHAFIFTCEAEDGRQYNYPFIVNNSEMDFRAAADALKGYIEQQYGCKVLAFRCFPGHKTMEELTLLCRMKTVQMEDAAYIALV